MHEPPIIDTHPKTNGRSSHDSPVIVPTTDLLKLLLHEQRQTNHLLVCIRCAIWWAAIFAAVIVCIGLATCRQQLEIIRSPF